MRRTTSSFKSTVIGFVLAILLVLEEAAANSYVRKGAMFTLAAITLAVLYRAWLRRSLPTEELDDEDDGERRASAVTRLVWAIWLTVAGIGSLLMAQILRSNLPELQSPLNGLGIFFLLVGTYKLFFGRKSSGTDLD